MFVSAVFLQDFEMSSGWPTFSHLSLFSLLLSLQNSATPDSALPNHLCTGKLTDCWGNTLRKTLKFEEQHSTVYT